MAAANPTGPADPGRPRPNPAAHGWLGLDYKWLVLIAMLPGFTVFLLDVTIVNVALARLGSVFEVNCSQHQLDLHGVGKQQVRGHAERPGDSRRLGPLVADGQFPFDC